MILLDTNVISALIRRTPDPAVVAWLDRQPQESIWITSISVFEARSGFCLLRSSARRQELEAAFARLLEEAVENRVLDFDTSAAAAAAELAAARQEAGRRMDFRDTLIAGIALARRAALATGNVRHFSDTSIQLLNPWST